MIYRRRASPLHAARAGAGCAYCLALALAAIVFEAPLLLGAVALITFAAGIAAGVGRELTRTLRYAIPFALVVALVNALVARQGVTVIARLGELPALGRVDVTLEATLYGFVLGLHAVALLLVSSLYVHAVDPDEVLRMLRRVSLRSALTATLATRMVPVLARDARRLGEAQRCLAPADRASRLRLVGAIAAGALDRAVDVAATLEVRGYSGVRRRLPPGRAPWSRHDIAFAAAALAIAALTIAGRLADAAPFSAYPSWDAPLPASALALAAGLAVCALVPFADRRGVAR